MILGTQLPSWKQILKKNKTRREKSYFEKDEVLLLSESCMSLGIVFEAIKNNKNKSRLCIWIPDYFCNQTIYSFRKEWMDIVYYKVKEDLEPDWDSVKEEIKESSIDAFVFTHYFGKYHASINRAKEICDLNDCILIEDCAHVLYGTDKMGQTGDFVIYSPHKQLPLADGAILTCNKTDKNKEIFEEVKKMYVGLPKEKNNNVWFLKKAIQKIIPVHRPLTYYSGVHIGEKRIEYHEPYKISKAGYNTLCDYTYEKLKKIAYVRRDNLATMNYIMKVRYPELIPYMDESTNTPYLAVYSLKNCSNKKSIVEDMLKNGFTVLYWPDLPYEIVDLTGHEGTLHLSEDIITIPIHQGITPQTLIKTLLKNRDEGGKQNLEIDFSKVTEERWNKVFDKYKTTNIPQEWIYGNAKSSTEGWRVVRGIITCKEEDIGTIQILEKRIAGITCAIRINRGPLFIEKYNNPKYHFEIMEIIRKKYSKVIPILWAPFIEFSAQNLKMATDNKWTCRDLFGFPSAEVDLSQSEEQLHKNLKANWRKNLKKAQKSVTIKYNEYNSNEIRKLYDGFLKKKNIPGIPDHILSYLFALDNPPLEVLTAHNEDGEMIAFKVLYLHKGTGTSFIAWNTDEGLEKNARTLLIYESMLWLKREGFKYFDLGGVDDINTEAVAKYKRGMGGRDYRLLGEFIKI